MTQDTNTASGAAHTRALENVALLADILSRRPAMNAGLTEAYAHWTNEVYNLMGTMAREPANDAALASAAAQPNTIAFMQYYETEEGINGWYLHHPQFYCDIEQQGKNSSKWSIFFRHVNGSEAYSETQAQPGADERRLRRILCARYEFLPYMDDGEAQGQKLDWLRCTVDQIEARILEVDHERFLASAAASALPAEQPDTAYAALPAECDSPELCAVSRSCAGQFGTKRICASRGQAPAGAASVTDAMVLAALQVQYPAGYGTQLRHPANGPKTSARTEAEIDLARRMIAAALATHSAPAAQAPSVLEDAARYRHIRDVPHSEEVRSVLSLQQNAVMDKVIDKDRAAMAAKKGDTHD